MGCKLPAMAKLVVIVLDDFAGETGEAFPSLSTLADKCGMGISTVKRQLKWLETVGMIGRERDPASRITHQSTRYRLDYDKLGMDDFSQGLAQSGPRAWPRAGLGLGPERAKARPRAGLGLAQSGPLTGHITGHRTDIRATTAWESVTEPDRAELIQVWNSTPGHRASRYDGRFLESAVLTIAADASMPEAARSNPSRYLIERARQFIASGQAMRDGGKFKGSLGAWLRDQRYLRDPAQEADHDADETATLQRDIDESIRRMQERHAEREAAKTNGSHR